MCMKKNKLKLRKKKRKDLIKNKFLKIIFLLFVTLNKIKIQNKNSDLL